MTPTTETDRDLEGKLESIDRHLQDIRQNVADILQNLQHELDAMREREFWRDYSRTYRDE